ncbi:hypothetical protein HRI_004327200 [Hibiscus trionum]|uniref:Uncharacterized protein n=1 Tax=Hibiscus trionum TaxID=183268 RepID=A0A9W7MP68_HIBTR|nr:hypothetical protein HRI_004327200 [Hibiscus trionum]
MPLLGSVEFVLNQILVSTQMGQPRMNLRAYLCCWRALPADMTRVVWFRQCVNPTMRSGCLSRHSQRKVRRLSVRYSYYKVLSKDEAKRPVGFGRHTMADRDITTNLT